MSEHTAWQHGAIETARAAVTAAAPAGDRARLANRPFRTVRRSACRGATQPPVSDDISETKPP